MSGPGDAPRLPSRSFAGVPLLGGGAAGRALVLTEPLSFWGGLDVATGRIIDRRHPQCGACVTGRVLVMPSGRGSSSSSSVLAEAVHAGTAPAAIVLLERDAIVALGALVAAELYGRVMPVVTVEADIFERLADGVSIDVRSDGTLSVE